MENVSLTFAWSMGARWYKFIQFCEKKNSLMIFPKHWTMWGTPAVSWCINATICIKCSYKNTFAPISHNQGLQQWWISRPIYLIYFVSNVPSEIFKLIATNLFHGHEAFSIQLNHVLDGMHVMMAMWILVEDNVPKMTTRVRD